MTTPPVPPEDDIGPFYKVLAGLLAIVACALLLMSAKQGKDLSWIHVGMFGVIACFVLALARPRWFDRFVKTVADKIPFFKFSKE